MNESTSVRTSDGAYMDGTFTKDMLKETLHSSVKIDEVYGNKAYLRKSILEDIESLNAKAFIPVSSVVYRLNESEYTYNKDSDEW